MTAIKKYEDRIKLYEGFIKYERVGPMSIPFYKDKIREAKRILKLLKEDKLTPKNFDELSHNDKWDIFWSGYLKNVKWFCKNCGCDQDTPHSVMDGEVLCSLCEHQLTKRTGGGQNNPFGWTFKYSLSQDRKRKLKNLNK